MSVRLHIDRLVLEGIDAASGDGEAIGEAARRELVALIEAQPLSLTRGFSVDRVRAAPSLSLPRFAGEGTHIHGAVSSTRARGRFAGEGTVTVGSAQAASIGHTVAHAVHGQLDPAAAPHRGRGS